MEGEFSQFCFGILIGLNPNLKVFVNLQKGRSSAKESDKNCKDQHNFCSHTVWRARAHYYKTIPVLLTTRFQGKRAPHWKKHMLFLISPFSYLCFLTIPWLGLHPKWDSVIFKEGKGGLWVSCKTHLFSFPVRRWAGGEAEEHLGSKTLEGRFCCWGLLNALKEPYLKQDPAESCKPLS